MESKKYVLFDEQLVNPQLKDYLDQKYEEYIDILDAHYRGESLEDNDKRLSELYTQMGEHLKANYSQEDLIYFYEFIHNRKHYYREKIYTKNRRHKSFTQEELSYDAVTKQEAIDFKKSYAEFASKDNILTKALTVVSNMFKEEHKEEIEKLTYVDYNSAHEVLMQCDILNRAREKFRLDIKAELGRDPWQEKDEEKIKDGRIF